MKRVILEELEEIVKFVNESDRECEFVISVDIGGEENGEERAADKRA